MLFAKVCYVCLDRSQCKNSSKTAIGNKYLTSAPEIQAFYQLELNITLKICINQWTKDIDVSFASIRIMVHNLSDANVQRDIVVSPKTAQYGTSKSAF